MAGTRLAGIRVGRVRNDEIGRVVAGMGVGILPKIALPKFRGSTMQALPIANPTLVRSVSIISLRGQSFSPAAKELTKAVYKNLRTQA